MTKERFEELALIMAKVEFNTDWECDDWETQSEKWKSAYLIGRRAALAAVYPLIRDDVIDECAVVAQDDDGYFTWSGTDKGVALRQEVAREAAAAIRALKSKDTKL